MSNNKDKNNNSFYELLKTLFYAGTILFFLDPFYLSHSIYRQVNDTIIIGWRLFVVPKYSYGYSKYSFPFGILPIKDKLIYDVPQRGDIIVLENRVMNKLII